jgi:hypothetical protein
MLYKGFEGVYTTDETCPREIVSRGRRRGPIGIFGEGRGRYMRDKKTIPYAHLYT